MNSSQLTQRFVMMAVLAVVACVGCDKKPEPAATQSVAPAPSPVASVVAPMPSATPPAPSTPPVEVPVPGPEAVEAGASGTLTVEPNPVPVCDQTGLGIATVKWTFTGTKYAEIRVDSPGGNLFASVKARGSQKTGQWVRKGTTFYLQYGNDGRAERTMARLTPDVVGGGPCP